jgi:hypothetical protein
MAGRVIKEAKLLLNNNSGGMGSWQSHPCYERKRLFLWRFLLGKYFAKIREVGKS